MAFTPSLSAAQERAEAPPCPGGRASHQPVTRQRRRHRLSAGTLKCSSGAGWRGSRRTADLTWGHRDVRDPAPLDPQPFRDVSHHARERGWGAGFRAMRGRWGVEAQYHQITGRAFHPSTLIGEVSFAGLELGSPEEPQDLLTAQGVPGGSDRRPQDRVRGTWRRIRPVRRARREPHRDSGPADRAAARRDGRAQSLQQPHAARTASRPAFFPGRQFCRDRPSDPAIPRPAANQRVPGPDTPCRGKLGYGCRVRTSRRRTSVR